MKIVFTNAFHHTSSEVVYRTTNRSVVVFDGRKLRRILEELCSVQGCACREDITISIDGKPAEALRFDPDVEDDEPGLELKIPPP